MDYFNIHNHTFLFTIKILIKIILKTTIQFFFFLKKYIYISIFIHYLHYLHYIYGINSSLLNKKTNLFLITTFNCAIYH